MIEAKVSIFCILPNSMLFLYWLMWLFCGWTIVKQYPIVKSQMAKAILSNFTQSHTPNLQGIGSKYLIFLYHVNVSASSDGVYY